MPKPPSPFAALLKQLPKSLQFLRPALLDLRRQQLEDEFNELHEETDLQTLAGVLVANNIDDKRQADIAAALETFCQDHPHDELLLGPLWFTYGTLLGDTSWIHEQPPEVVDVGARLTFDPMCGVVSHQGPCSLVLWKPVQLILSRYDHATAGSVMAGWQRFTTKADWPPGSGRFIETTEVRFGNHPGHLMIATDAAGKVNVVQAMILLDDDVAVDARIATTGKLRSFDPTVPLRMLQTVRVQ